MIQQLQGAPVILVKVFEIRQSLQWPAVQIDAEGLFGDQASV